MIRIGFLFYLVVCISFLLYGCGRSEPIREDEVSKEETSSQPTKETPVSASDIDPDRRTPKPETPPQEESSTPSEPTKEPVAEERTPGEQSPPQSLSQVRQELDTMISELKAALFESLDGFKAEEIANKLSDLFTRVGGADSNDPRMYEIIKKVMENYEQMLSYLPQGVAGAKQYFSEMERHYQEWKALMK